MSNKLKEIRKELGISQSALADMSTISQAYISEVETGKRKMSDSARGLLLNSLRKHYPDSESVFAILSDIDCDISDNENAVKNNSDNDVATGLSIPLLNIDSVGGMLSTNEVEDCPEYIEQRVMFPTARLGDIAVHHTGRSMEPMIPAGSILHIRRVDGWREYFGFGNVFVLVLADGRRVTKEVVKSVDDPSGSVTCVSYNPDGAQEDLPKTMIAQVWQVISVLINKGW